MATIYHLGGYGSGKSSGALKEAIYNELLNGTRGIVTNVSLLQEPKQKGKKTSTKPGLGALNELLNRRFKNLDARVIQRVRILTEDEVPHFFCHRISRGGLHYDIPVPTVEAEKRGARPDFSLLRDDGIVFVIDEFHDYFNARLWAEVGRSVGWYKNQQRKIGDDIHACTPQIDEVDKQLRTIGHEYRVYNNLGLRKVRGVVMPQAFICAVYSSLDSVKRKGQPLNKFAFTLDIELANCYDTAKGVRGLQGGNADIGKRPKGIHWVWPLIFVAVVVGSILFAAFWFRHRIVKKARSIEVPSANSTSPISSRIPFSHAPDVSTNFLTNLVSPIQVASPVFCTGWCKIGDVYYATLSDGSQYSSADHELDFIRKHEISILGKTYPIKLMPIPLSTPQIQQVLRQNDNPLANGQISPPRPVNQIQVIPFPESRHDTPLPAEDVVSAGSSFDNNFSARR